MASAEQSFEEIYAQFPVRHPAAAHGNMMRAPALTVNGNVFCFYYKKHDAMCFKLGKDADPTRPELLDASLLSPFKKKGPIKGWFIVPFTEATVYWALAEEAFEKVSG